MSQAATATASSATNTIATASVGAAAAAAPKSIERQVLFGSDNKVLTGDLVVPANAKGIVVFAHGSGSSRFSPRNRSVAQVLQNAGHATLLVDLLTPAEESVDDYTGELRFDIEMLANRLVNIANAIEKDNELKSLRVGYFGASTGGGAALSATAKLPPGKIAAVVSRGGRPDLCPLEALAKVTAPTLLLIGERDPKVIEMNSQAYVALKALVDHDTKRMQIVKGATHLFEEKGTLEIVANAAKEWFTKWFAPAVGAMTVLNKA